MISENRRLRTVSFAEVQRVINERQFKELEFSKTEISLYRQFSDQISSVVSSIGADSKFERDPSRIVEKLKKLHQKTMLEEVLPAPNKLVGVFVLGEFRYWRNTEVQIETIRKFLELLEKFSEEKRSIVVENILSKLEAVDRTKPDYDDEIPF